MEVVGEGTTVVPSDFLSKNMGIRIATGITSFLSILGSFLIIFSYIFFRDTRTRARLILLHLSLTDLGVGLANFVGDVVDFDRFYINSTSLALLEHPEKAVNIACVTQAFLAQYFTISSILWTCILSVYMYFLVVEKGSFVARYYMWTAYVLCYGIPLIIAIWMLKLKRLGYSPYNSSGWCSLNLVKFSTAVSDSDDSKMYRRYFRYEDIFTALVAYDIWIFTTIVVTVVVYVSTHFFIRREKSLRSVSQMTGHSDTLFNVEFKFLLIPVMFIVLRMWSLINNILFVYIGFSSVPTYVTHMMEYLTGIGDSGQGAVNGFIFVLLTKDIRKRLCSCACLRHRLHNEESNSLLHYDHHSPNLNKSGRSSAVVARKHKAEPEPPSVYTPVSSYED